MYWTWWVYKANFLFEWKQQPDKSHVALNQWPALRRCNCPFTASSKSLHTFLSLISPCRYHADSGCLAAAVLQLILLSFLLCDWWTTTVLLTSNVLKPEWCLEWKSPEISHRCRTTFFFFLNWSNLYHPSLQCACVHMFTNLQPSACIQPGCRSSSHILHWAGRW